MRYFLHLRDDVSEVLDLEGREYASLDALKTAVRGAVRELIGYDAADGTVDLRFRLDAEDRHGALVHSLAFWQAVRVILPDGGSVRPCGEASL